MPELIRRPRILLLLFVIALPRVSIAAGEGQGLIQWQDWSKDLFDQARQQQRMVIMDLEAVWCHWCHVMEAKTYSHPDVAELINTHWLQEMQIFGLHR